jgi:nitrite reductase/ring-hydroxylating ferredoxin subunit
VTTRILACHLDEFAPGTSMTVEAAGPIALFRTDDGRLYATDDTCTHEKWSLGEDSDLDGTEVTCPLHMARFDLVTGEALCFPATIALRTYEVEVDSDGSVHVVV